MQIVTDMTRCITTIILTLINEPLQSYSGTSSIEHLLNYGRYDDNTEERYLLLCKAVPTCQKTMCCCLTVSGSDSIYPCIPVPCPAEDFFLTELSRTSSGNVCSP